MAGVKADDPEHQHHLEFRRQDPREPERQHGDQVDDAGDA
jgi:hypothetical protein